MHNDNLSHVCRISVYRLFADAPDARFFPGLLSAIRGAGAEYRLSTQRENAYTRQAVSGGLGRGLVGPPSAAVLSGCWPIRTYMYCEILSCLELIMEITPGSGVLDHRLRSAPESRS